MADSRAGLGNRQDEPITKSMEVHPPPPKKGEYVEEHRSQSQRTPSGQSWKILTKIWILLLLTIGYLIF